MAEDVLLTLGDPCVHQDDEGVSLLIPKNVVLNTNDTILFKVVKRLEDVGLLPKMRERLFVELDIFAINNRSLPEPIRLECGIYKDEFQAANNGGAHAAHYLDAANFWKCQIQSGTARMTEADRGAWTVKSCPFIKGETLRMVHHFKPVVEGAPVRRTGPLFRAVFVPMAR